MVKTLRKSLIPFNAGSFIPQVQPVQKGKTQFINDATNSTGSGHKIINVVRCISVKHTSLKMYLVDVRNEKCSVCWKMYVLIIYLMFTISLEQQKKKSQFISIMHGSWSVHFVLAWWKQHRSKQGLMNKPQEERQLRLLHFDLQLSSLLFWIHGSFQEKVHWVWI